MSQRAGVKRVQGAVLDVGAGAVNQDVDFAHPFASVLYQALHVLEARGIGDGDLDGDILRREFLLQMCANGLCAAPRP